MSVYKKKMASGKLYNGQFSDDDVSQQKFKFLSIFEKKLEQNDFYEYLLFITIL